MRRFSVRTRLGAVTLGFMAVVAGLAILGNATGPSRSFSPSDIARGSVAPDRRVRIVGTVVSSDPGGMVLAPMGASAPIVVVRLAQTDVGRATFDPGVVVRLDGTVTDSRGLVQATVVSPSGPSKFRRQP